MGFTFDGIHCSYYGMKSKTITLLLPETRDREEEVSGKDGVWYFGSDYKKRPVEEECILKGSSRADFLQKCSQVAAWLDIKKGERVLVLDETPDKYCMARYSGRVPLDQLVMAGKFTLPFVLSDPYFYPINEAVQTATITANNQTVTVVKDVNSVEEYPKIKITNNGSTVTNITLTRTT